MMKRVLFLAVLFGLVLLAQTGGTVDVTTQTTIKASAGDITCTFTSGTSIHTSCAATGGATLTSDFPTPIAQPGTVGNFSAAGNSITWSFKPNATSGGTDWQVVANGTSKAGTF